MILKTTKNNSILILRETKPRNLMGTPKTPMRPAQEANPCASLHKKHGAISEPWRMGSLGTKTEAHKMHSHRTTGPRAAGSERRLRPRAEESQEPRNSASVPGRLGVAGGRNGADGELGCQGHRMLVPPLSSGSWGAAGGHWATPISSPSFQGLTGLRSQPCPLWSRHRSSSSSGTRKDSGSRDLGPSQV